DFKEFGGGAGNFGLVEHGIERLCLRICRENRTANETLQIGAFVQHGLEFIEIGSYRIDGFLVARQFEQGRSITAGHSRNGRIFSSHNSLFSAVKLAREKPSPRVAAPSDPSPWNSSGTSIFDRHARCRDR